MVGPGYVSLLKNDEEPKKVKAFFWLLETEGLRWGSGVLFTLPICFRFVCFGGFKFKYYV